MTRNLLPVFVAAMIFVGGLALAQTPAANPKVLLKTSKGDITLELYPAKAPITVKNILDYVNDKFYDGLIFHRVIPGFMIQCGGLTADMSEKTRNRPRSRTKPGTASRTTAARSAMARLRNRTAPASQFFINLVNNNPQPQGQFGRGLRLLRLRQGHRRDGRRRRHRQGPDGQQARPRERARSSRSPSFRPRSSSRASRRRRCSTPIFPFLHLARPSGRRGLRDRLARPGQRPPLRPHHRPAPIYYIFILHPAVKKEIVRRRSLKK